MTLIYTALGDGLVAISDVMLSSPTKSASKVNLPFRTEPLSHRTGNLCPSGLAHKSVLAENTLILWAGSYPVARSVIEAVMDASRQGRLFADFPRILGSIGLDDSELQGASFIYHYCDGERIQQFPFNCYKIQVGRKSVCYQGSGAWDFVDNTRVTPAGEARSPNAQAFFGNVGRAIFNLASEAWSTKNYDYLYGGWLEIIVDEQEKLVKLPYAIKFWQRTDAGLVLSLPVFFSWYVGHDLVICRADVEEGGSSVNLHGIRDFLRRPGGLGEEIPAAQWKPRIVFHVVGFEGSDQIDIWIKKDVDPGFQVTVDSRTGGMGNQISKWLMDELSAEYAGDGPSFVLEKPFDDCV